MSVNTIDVDWDAFANTNSLDNDTLDLMIVNKYSSGLFSITSRFDDNVIISGKRSINISIVSCTLLM